ncbi:MAG: hypothetical protein SVY15_09260, partial [Halobacteriota archaeon]|nr:hypothetical protein [Halobacteriota archaeon]
IHASVDKEGHPLRIVISAANEHDSLHFIDLACKISLKGERCRPTRFDEKSYKNRGAVKEIQCMD